MALRERMARLFGAKASIVGLTVDELADRPLEKATGTISDGDLLSTYRDDAWPYILANKIGEQASQAPITVGRVKRGKNGEEEFEPVGPDHPVQAVFDNPNPHMDGGEFTHLLMLYMELVGHEPIEVAKPGPGMVIGAPGRTGRRQRAGFELYLHNPDPWRIVPSNDGQIMGYLYLRSGLPDIRWTPDQMCYLRWPNPNHRWYGQGRLTAIRQQVMALEYGAERDKRFEKNLGVPPGILSTEMPIGDPQARELQRRWETAVGGYRNAGKIAVLGSKTVYQPVTMSARDAQFLEQIKHRVETLAAGFGVPMPLILMQDAKFANAQEARAEFWEGTLQPRLNRIARMLTVRLLPLITSEPLEVRFDYTKIEALGENDLEAAQTAGAWSDTGSVTVDEIRKRLSLPPHPDKTIGQRLVVPSTKALQDPAQIAEQEKLAAEAAQAGIDSTRASAQATLNPPKDPNRAPPGKSETKADTPEREALLAPVRASYERDLASYFLAQRGALNGAFKALPQDEAEDILQRAIDILTAKRFRDRLRRISQPAIETALTFGANEAARTLGVGVSFSIPASEAALARVTSHLNALGTGIENTTVADVRRVLTDALRAGGEAPQIRAALDTLFDGYQEWRLDRIARTETIAAYNVGAIGQYRDAGVQLVKVSDGDTDAPCAHANGAEWTLDMAEADPVAHPNCTRTWIPITDSFLRAATPAATKAEPVINVTMPAVNLTFAEGSFRAEPAAVTVQPEVNVTVPQTTVNVAAPVVRAEVARDELADVRQKLADVKAEIAKPRRRSLTRDEMGRVTGSVEEID